MIKGTAPFPSISQRVWHLGAAQLGAIVDDLLLHEVWNLRGEQNKSYLFVEVVSLGSATCGKCSSSVPIEARALFMKLHAIV